MSVHIPSAALRGSGLVSTGSSLLSRSSASAWASPVQSQVDAMVGGFASQATDWHSLGAIFAGGAAYRLGRLGVLGLGGGNVARGISYGLGLTAEVSAFELTHRGLSSLGAGSLQSNLWSWNGSGGLRQGLFSSFITFGALKGAGRLGRSENVFVQHLLQDTAMVTGHQIAGAWGLGPRPQGSLAQQFLHAEATNLQLGAGMALTGRVAPGLHSLERGLDLSLQSRDGFRLPPSGLPEAAYAVPMGALPHRTNTKRDLAWIMNQAELEKDPNNPRSTEGSESMVTPTTASAPAPALIPRAGRIPEIPGEIDSFETLVEHEPIMVIVTDAEKRIVYSNVEAHRVMGEDLLGQRIEELLDLNQAGAHPQYRLRTDDGHELLWEDRQHPFILNFTVHYFLDVTGKVENERLRDELVRLRIKAGEGFLAKGLAHDVRSALTPGNMVIDHLIRLVEGMGQPDAETLARLPKAYREPMALLEIVRTSLKEAQSTLDAGRQILRGGNSSFSLHSVLVDALHQNLPQRTEKNIQLKTAIEPRLGLYGNQGGIAEALRNILDNACQSMPEGGLLTVKAFIRERNVVIEVTDTGVGIPAENFGAIFTEDFTTKGADGTGLGLPMAKRIIEELHGGRIEVESEVGRGSTFRFILPHVRSDPPPSSRP